MDTIEGVALRTGVMSRTEHVQERLEFVLPHWHGLYYRNHSGMLRKCAELLLSGIGNVHEFWPKENMMEHTCC